MYRELRGRALGFGLDVKTYATMDLFVFKAQRCFANIAFLKQKGALRILVRPEGFTIGENQTAQVHGVMVKRLPDTHHWSLNHEFSVTESSDPVAVEKLLRQSYEAVAARKPGAATLAGMGALFLPESDAKYLDWLKAHPAGFVINTRRPSDRESMVLHRASCKKIMAAQAGAEPGGFTERQYSKVCAPDVAFLRVWVAANGRPDGTFSNECGICKPTNAT